MKKTLLWFILLGLLTWSACTTPTPPSETPPQVKEPTETPSGASPLESSLESPLESPLEVPQSSKEEIAASLKQDLAAELDVAPETLNLISIEAVEWPNASLGCPQPGKMYAQVITPGWRLILEDKASNRYDVRAPKAGESFIICEGKPAEPTPPEAKKAPASVIDAAKRLVAERKGIAEEILTVEQAEAVEWNNACLGCARPDEMCLTVITPGYRLVLRAGDTVYEVHTDQEGRSARLCEGVGGGPVRPPKPADVPDEVWNMHEDVLVFLNEQHLGFGLKQLPPTWEPEDVTEPEKLGVSRYRFTNSSWNLAYTCPVIAEPQCDVGLYHREAGRLWQGTVHGDGTVQESTAQPTLTYEVGECDESLTGEALNTWAGAVVTPIEGGLDFVHRIAYNCCADIVASLGQDPERNILRLVETNRGEVCRCMCGYEMTGSVTGLQAERYTVQFWGVQKPDLHPLEQLERIDVDIPQE